jgi:mannitol-specific phosphotransferase system IIBC component
VSFQSKLTGRIACNSLGSIFAILVLSTASEVELTSVAFIIVAVILPTTISTVLLRTSVTSWLLKLILPILELKELTPLVTVAAAVFHAEPVQIAKLFVVEFQ